MQVLLSLLVCFWGNLAGRNPFLGRKFYVNPANQQEYSESIKTANGYAKANLQKMHDVASAYWIDVKSKIRGNTTRTVEGILRDAASKTPKEVVVLIWYDLPNRDCDAHASNGEICCTKNPDNTCDYLAPGDCEKGLEEYRQDYVDPFIDVLKMYDHSVPIVIVFEPDSLPNLATNLDDPKCNNDATKNAYKLGSKYALTRLYEETDVTVYVDAGHGGWLGWANNMKEFMNLLSDMNLDWKRIRGFSTDVSGYQPLGIMCPWKAGADDRNNYCLNGQHTTDPCCEDPCKELGQWNPANNELNYAQELVKVSSKVLAMEAHIITDTSRNGVPDARKDCKNWCNIRGAGAGIPSTTDVSNPEIIDAYFWLKTPGESDGCTEKLPNGEQCPRFDKMCGSSDSVGSVDKEPRAPEAGAWFDYQVKQLALNAQFSNPQPAPAPPSVPSPPPSPPSGSGHCCFYKPDGCGCAAQGNWCDNQESNCQGCGGFWCPGTLENTLGTSGSPTAILGVLSSFLSTSVFLAHAAL